MSELRAFGVAGIGEVRAGDDVAVLVADALGGAGEELRDGDVLVVSSKIVSKAEGRTVPDGDRDRVVDSQTVRVVAERTTPRGSTRIVESRSGPVLAAAGVDASNVDPGTLLLLPADPDASARAIRDGLAGLTGARVGVVVSDTAGRPWRDGQVDIAIGAAGVAVTDDLRGATDEHGRTLEVTVRALADELASLGDLLKGKLDGVPVAVVRGLPPEALAAGDGPGAAALLRGADQDWFRYGHVEAVQAAAGLDPSEVAFPPPAVPEAPVLDRFARVLAIATTVDRAVPLSPPENELWATTGKEMPLNLVRRGGTATVQVTWRAAELQPDELTAVSANLGAIAQVARMVGWAEGLTITSFLLPLKSQDDRPTLLMVLDPERHGTP